MMVSIILRSILGRCVAVVTALAVGFTLLSAGQTQAQLRIEITEGQVAPTPIAIAEFTGLDGNVSDVGRQLTQVISDDLESSGLFRPVDSAAFIDPPKAPSVKPDFANLACRQNRSKDCRHDRNDVRIPRGAWHPMESCARGIRKL